MTATRVMDVPVAPAAPAAVEPLHWKKRVGRTVIAAVAASALVVVVPRLLGLLDYFHVQTVQLEGARFLTPTAVIEALGADTSASVFEDPANFERKVEKIPLVASARVRRRLPGTLVVSIVERTPVALVPSREGFRGVDSAGTRLPIDPALSSFDAPVVLPPQGTHDTVADRRLFNLLGALRLHNPALFDAIEEARRISATEWQLRTTRQLVRVTPQVTLARLADIFPVEQDLARRHIRAAELDLRYRNLVIARLP
ncbi:MAG TPA: FtsQ-type POTRA domain-containing protein [Gemmatimonadaceae bacterium]|nr:FtsQ-type POTRA domain-containing protein [Gemmatimonadaceae bacterium]